MRILITHELFPPNVAGGGEALVYRLAKKMADDGHSVKVVTSGNPDEKSYGGVETVRIPANRYLMNIISFPTILKHAREADVIQTSSGNMALPSYIAAKILGKPICCWIHHIFGKYWRDIRGPIVGRMFEIFERAILTRGFNQWVFQNKSSKEIGIGMGVPKNRISMISPGIDHEKFSKIRSKRGKNALFVGNFCMDEPTIKTKGIGYLLEAARMLPKVDFLLLGNFKEKKLPKNVRAPGTVPYDKLIETYSKAGVFVCSSLNEGFSLALLEAMASGCPIVSTIDIGQCGVKVVPKDAAGIAKGVMCCLDDPKKARAQGDQNRKLARRYSWKKFYADFDKLYKSLNNCRDKR